MNGAQGGGYGQQYGQRSMPYGGSYGGGGMFGMPQGYGQQRSFGQNYGGAFGGQPRQQSVGPSGIPPWANQNQPGNPYNSTPRMPSNSGAPMNNFGNLSMPRTGGQDTYNDPSMGVNSAMPRTGGVNYANAPMTPDFGMSKPAQYQPQQTGGQDYFNSPTPSFQTPIAQESQPFMPGGPQAAQAPSWEQQNSQLLRPAQMQDPALAKATGAAPPMPPGPGNPLTPPPGTMQTGQAGWEWNSGSPASPYLPNPNPRGWVPQFSPGYQQYISSNMAGLSPDQMRNFNYNDILGSINQLTGASYNPTIYGAR